MAKITRVFASGKLGNLVFYELNGQPVVRSRPERIKQTAATIQEGRLFGQAKKISRVLRTGLAPLVANARDVPLMYRVDRAVREWLKSGQEITGPIVGALSQLPLNAATQWRDYFRQPMAVDWQEPARPRLMIPALELPRQILAPPGTQLVQLVVAVAGCRLADATPIKGSCRIITIPYTNGLHPPATQEMEMEPVPGSLQVIGVALKYFKGDDAAMVVGDARWGVGAVVGGWFGGR